MFSSPFAMSKKCSQSLIWLPLITWRAKEFNHVHVFPAPEAISSMLCPLRLYLPPDSKNEGQGRYAFIGHQPNPGRVAIPPWILPSPLQPISATSLPHPLQPPGESNEPESGACVERTTPSTLGVVCSFTFFLSCLSLLQYITEEHNNFVCWYDNVLFQGDEKEDSLFGGFATWGREILLPVMVDILSSGTLLFLAVTVPWLTDDNF